MNDNRRRNLDGDRLIFGPSGIVGVRVKVGVLNRDGRRGTHWNDRRGASTGVTGNTPWSNVIFLAAVIDVIHRNDRRRNLNGDRLIFRPSGVVGVRVKVGVLNRDGLRNRRGVYRRDVDERCDRCRDLNGDRLIRVVPGVVSPRVKVWVLNRDGRLVTGVEQPVWCPPE